MSESTDKTLLEQLKYQHEIFCQERDKSQINLNQLIGAIYACEIMIKKYEDQGVIENGKTDVEQKGKTAQK